MKINFATKTLDDDYELSQLVPVYTAPAVAKTKLQRAIDRIPETTAIRMRMAVFDAVIDDIIEDEILDEDGNQVQSSIIEEKVLETVDKAVELHLVPSVVRNRIPSLIAAHLRRRDPKMQLVSKAAHFLVGNMVKMEESDTVITHLVEDDDVVDQTIDRTPGDDGVNTETDTVVPEGDSAQECGRAMRGRMEDNVIINDLADDIVVDDTLGTKTGDDGYDIERETVEFTGDSKQEGGSVPVNRYKNKKFQYRMLNGKVIMEEVEPDEPVVEEALDTDKADEGVDVTKEVIEFDGDTAQTDGTTPTIVDQSMKYLAISAVNHRKATAAVARNISSRLLIGMLHDLRNVLPKKFKAKYGIK